MSQNYSGRLAVVVSALLIALLAIFWPSVKSPILVGFNRNVPFSQKTNLKPVCDLIGGFVVVVWWLAVPQFPFLIFGPAQSFLKISPALLSVP